MPPSLASKPDLSWHMNRYLTAYMDLDAHRQSGYSMAQPLTEIGILSYGWTHGFKYDLRFFFRAMTALDAEYLKKEAEKLKTKANKAKSQANNPRRGRRAR